MGPYRLLQLIAAGGMGEVYLAEQAAPIRRYVAIKLIKHGLDTREIIARFEIERQALALMSHPCIAAVFDGGATADGRPYFAMEYVPGQPITDFCDEHKLSIQARVELMIDVCKAIQHAHQKGVVHRDLKPGNILVELRDSQTSVTPPSGSHGRAQPKIIDFGIAKALDERLTDQDAFTRPGVLVGTPESMAPEQADPRGLDIDTRVDVYALGALLYELLIGEAPFASAELRRKPFNEIVRIICEVDPPAPSVRLALERRAQGDDYAAGIARQRATDPVGLSRAVRGDLDWIVMRCLEKERSRRYESASAIALDLRRHLDYEPVLASPPSRVYRISKFVRRNRTSVAVGAALAVMLAVGAAGMSTLALWAMHDRDAAAQAARAAQGLAEQARAAQQAAERNREEADQAAVFQAKVIEDVDLVRLGAQLRENLLQELTQSLQREHAMPERSEQQRELLSALLSEINLSNFARRTIEQGLLDRALTVVNEQYEQQPMLQARLLMTLGRTYAALGLGERAEPPIRKVIELRSASLGREHEETIGARVALSLVLAMQGRFEEAIRECEQVIALARHSLPADHGEILGATANLGLIYLRQGQPSQAEPILRGVYEQELKKRGEADPRTLIALNNLASALDAGGKLTEAEPLYRRGLELSRRILGPDHPDTLTSVSNLGFILLALERPEEAEPLYREALEKRRRQLGDEHPMTLLSMGNMAFLLQRIGQLDEGLRLHRLTCETSRRVLGDTHPDTLMSINNLASLLRKLGHANEAEALYREAFAGYQAVFGEQHWETVNARIGLGAALRDQGRFAEAHREFTAAEPYILTAEAAPPEFVPQVVEAIAELYDRWHAAAPDEGHDAKAAEWRAKLSR